MRLPEKPNRKVKQMWNKLNPYWKDILIALALYLPLTVYTLCWPPSIGLLTLPFLEDVALANYILLLIPTLLAWLCSWKMSSVRPYFVSGISLTMNLGLWGYWLAVLVFNNGELWFAYWFSTPALVIGFIVALIRQAGSKAEGRAAFRTGFLNSFVPFLLAPIVIILFLIRPR